MQLGGKGLHAIKLLLAGARESWLLTPMLQEARWARELAQRLHLADRLHVALGVAEALPFTSSSIDAIYAGGSVHHMTTGMAFGEIARVLRPGGRFAAAEPWRTPWYAVGTAIFGKREANPFCRPLTAERVAPLRQALPQSRVIHHGTFTRYPMLVMQKLGISLPLNVAWRINEIDDAIVCDAHAPSPWKQRSPARGEMLTQLRLPVASQEVVPIQATDGWIEAMAE